MGNEKPKEKPKKEKEKNPEIIKVRRIFRFSLLMILISAAVIAILMLALLLFEDRVQRGYEIKGIVIEKEIYSYYEDGNGDPLQLFNHARLFITIKLDDGMKQVVETKNTDLFDSLKKGNQYAFTAKNFPTLLRFPRYPIIIDSKPVENLIIIDRDESTTETVTE